MAQLRNKAPRPVRASRRHDVRLRGYRLAHAERRLGRVPVAVAVSSVPSPAIGGTRITSSPPGPPTLALPSPSLPIVEVRHPGKVGDARIAIHLRQQRGQLASVVGLVVEELNHQRPCRQRPILLVRGAVESERSLDPGIVDRFGPLKYLPVRQESFATQIVEVRVQLDSKRRYSRFRTQEACQPGPIRPEQMVQRPVDGPKEGAAITPSFCVRDPRAQIILARHAPQGVTLKHYQDFSILDLWGEIRKLPPIRATAPGAEAAKVAATGTEDGQALASEGVVLPVVQQPGRKGVKVAASDRMVPVSCHSDIRRKPLENREETLIAAQERTGADRTRTGDLLVANQTLSQLSYGPWGIDKAYHDPCRRPTRPWSSALVTSSMTDHTDRRGKARHHRR